jgi:predicted outer membrane repeat protein
MKRILWSLGVLFVGFTLNSLAAVRIQGGAYYNSITAAVAEAVNGNVILVSTGTFAESVSIPGKHITIDGRYNSTLSAKVENGRTIIDPPYGSALSISGATVRVEGLDLTGGAPLITTPFYGGGMFIESGSSVTVMSCRIYGNYANGFGGGIYVEDSSLWLNDSQVSNNTASSYTIVQTTYPGHGGGIALISSRLYMGGSSIVTSNRADATGGGLYMEQSEAHFTGASVRVFGNLAERGGGVAANHQSFLRLADGVRMYANHATEAGGGFWLSNQSTGLVTGTGTDVGIYYLGTPNSALNGGGAYTEKSTLLIQANASFNYNSATLNGGAICASNSLLCLNDAQIGRYGLGNSNSAYYGGGIYLSDHSRLILTNGAGVKLSSAQQHGGGIYASRSTLILYSNCFVGGTGWSDQNIARAGCGGGLFAVDSTQLLAGASIQYNVANGYGGGAYIQQGQLDYADTTITSNSATHPTSGKGGGLFVFGAKGSFTRLSVSNNWAGDCAGGLRLMDTELNIVDSLFAENHSEHEAGALKIEGTQTNRLIRVDLLNNTAQEDGGAVFVMSSAPVEFEDCTFVGNAADSDGNNTGHGGALYINGSNVVIRSTGTTATLEANEAVHGGGIYVAGTKNLELAGNVRITDCTATKGGALFACSGAVVRCTTTNEAAPLFHSNEALQSGGALYAEGNATLLDLYGVQVGRNNHGYNEGNTAKGVAASMGGGGVYISNSTLKAVNCRFEYNLSYQWGGGIYSDNGTVILGADYSQEQPSIWPTPRVAHNTSYGHGGGLYLNGGNGSLSNALLACNESPTGGGLYAANEGQARLVNVVVISNEASTAGGGVCVEGPGTQATMIHCTLTRNTSLAASALDRATFNLTNCIVYYNRDGSLTAGQRVDYSDVQDGYPGTGNLNVAPGFMNINALDCRLTYASKGGVVDAGTYCGLSSDCIGETRPTLHNQPDMGAYEYNGATTDSDNDQMIDNWEEHYELNPLMADAGLNPDDDEFDNFDEYIADTDPQDGDDYLQITSVQRVGNETRIYFNSSANRVYSLEACAVLQNGNWQGVAGQTNHVGTGTTQDYLVDSSTSSGVMNYELKVRLP